jgi:hypothetical protein
MLSTISTDLSGGGLDLLQTVASDGPYRMLSGCEPFKLTYMDFDPSRFANEGGA